VAVHHAAGIGKGLHQRRGQHHVPHAQAGVEGLAEGADVERALILVQALHAGSGFAVVVKLAVVVILDDPFAFLGSPVDQLQAPFQGQGYASGVLMHAVREQVVALCRRYPVYS